MGGPRDKIHARYWNYFYLLVFPFEPPYCYSHWITSTIELSMRNENQDCYFNRMLKSHHRRISSPDILGLIQPEDMGQQAIYLFLHLVSARLTLLY
jgi:hypothetical protein